jgi:hypothetical protein
MAIKILGVEMISQAEVGELIGIKAKSTVCEWLARAGIEGTPINKTRYYSTDLIRDYLRYGKLEVRQAVEILRQIKTFKGEKR